MPPDYLSPSRVCRRAGRLRRVNDAATESPTNDPPSGAGPWATATAVDVIEVTGPDAVSYLHGQLSQTVSGLVVGAWADTLLLEPQGKMCAWLRLHRTADDSVHLVSDPTFGAVVEARLRRFWLRTKAELILRDAVPTLAVRDWPAGRDAPPADPAASLLMAPARWPGHAGFDLIGAEATVPEGVTLLEARSAQTH